MVFRSGPGGQFLCRPPVFLLMATNYDALSASICSTNEDDVLHRSIVWSHYWVRSGESGHCVGGYVSVCTFELAYYVKFLEAWAVLEPKFWGLAVPQGSDRTYDGIWTPVK